MKEGENIIFQGRIRKEKGGVLYSVVCDDNEYYLMVDGDQKKERVSHAKDGCKHAAIVHELYKNEFGLEKIAQDFDPGAVEGRYYAKKPFIELYNKIKINWVTVPNEKES